MLLMPTPAQLAQNAELLAHMLFTLHLTVDPNTGATLKRGAVDLNGNNCAWMAAVYKAIHPPDTGLDAKDKALKKAPSEKVLGLTHLAVLHRG
jgi:hypothetical protein